MFVSIAEKGILKSSLIINYLWGQNDLACFSKGFCFFLFWFKRIEDVNAMPCSYRNGCKLMWTHSQVPGNTFWSYLSSKNFSFPQFLIFLLGNEMTMYSVLFFFFPFFFSLLFISLSISTVTDFAVASSSFSKWNLRDEFSQNLLDHREDHREIEQEKMNFTCTCIWWSR